MEINNFGPFHSGVYGTVSDVIVLLVSMATLYYLYQTFQSQGHVLRSQQESLKSQLEIQKLQEKITTFEQIRFASEVAPIFKAEIHNRGVNNFDDEGLQLDASFKITNISTYSAHKITVTLEKATWSKQEPYDILDYLPPNETQTIWISGPKDKNAMSNGHFIDNKCDVLIHYSDVMGNKFIHTFTYNPYNNPIAGGAQIVVPTVLYDSNFKRVL